MKRNQGIIAAILGLIILVVIGALSYHQGYLNGYVEASMMGCVGEFCDASTGCRLPMDFAIRSNCPYQAFCVDNKCKVACVEPYETEAESVIQAKQCTADSECDCTFYLGAYMEGCRCVDGMCAVIVA